MTAEEIERHEWIIAQIELEKPRLNAIGLAAKREFDQRQARLKETVAALRSTRQELRLSLSDIEERTGIAKSNLSRLENSPNPNPTIQTLTRYAHAVGKEIVITLADKS